MLIWIYLVYLLALVYISMRREKLSDLESLKKAWFWFALIFVLQGVLSIEMVQELFGMNKKVRAGNVMEFEAYIRGLKSVYSIYPVTAIFLGISLLRLRGAFGEMPGSEDSPE